MSVGVYALTYPKSMGTLKFGMENASWVNIETGSDARARSHDLKTNYQSGTHFPHSWVKSFIFKKSTKEFHHEWLEKLRNLECIPLDSKH